MRTVRPSISEEKKRQIVDRYGTRLPSPVLEQSSQNGPRVPLTCMHSYALDESLLHFALLLLPLLYYQGYVQNRSQIELGWDAQQRQAQYITRAKEHFRTISSRARVQAADGGLFAPLGIVDKVVRDFSKTKKNHGCFRIVIQYL